MKEDPNYPRQVLFGSLWEIKLVSEPETVGSVSLEKNSNGFTEPID